MERIAELEDCKRDKMQAEYVEKRNKEVKRRKNMMTRSDVDLDALEYPKKKIKK